MSLPHQWLLSLDGNLQFDLVRRSHLHRGPRMLGVDVLAEDSVLHPSPWTPLMHSIPDGFGVRYFFMVGAAVDERRVVVVFLAVDVVFDVRRGLCIMIRKKPRTCWLERGGDTQSRGNG